MTFFGLARTVLTKRTTGSNTSPNVPGAAGFGEAQRWRFEQERAVETGRADGGGERRHPAEARAHQDPATRIAAQLQ